MFHARNWISSAICRDPFGVQLFKVRNEHGCFSVDIDGIVGHHCIITILNVVFFIRGVKTNFCTVICPNLFIYDNI